VIHPDTAEIWECFQPISDGQPRWRLYRDNTYVIVQVLKGYKGQPASTLEFEEVETFKSALVASRAGAAGTGVPNSLSTQAAALVGRNEFEAARAQLGVLREAIGAGEPNRRARALLKIGEAVTSLQPNAADATQPAMTVAQVEYIFDNLTELATIDIPASDFVKFSAAHWNKKQASDFARDMSKFFVSPANEE
ncbi:MAG: hypothetical protein AAFV54_10605, partial [Pseudomonadota bacterium]